MKKMVVAALFLLLLVLASPSSSAVNRSQPQLTKLEQDSIGCYGFKCGQLQDSYDDLMRAYNVLFYNYEVARANLSQIFSQNFYEKDDMVTQANDTFNAFSIKVCGERFRQPDSYERRNCSTKYWIACTSSMIGTFSCYNALIVYETDDIRLWDIIMFRIPPTNMTDASNRTVSANFLIHRVVAFNDTGAERRYVTKGDNLYYADPYSLINPFPEPSAHEVIGKISTVMY